MNSHEKDYVSDEDEEYVPSESGSEDSPEDEYEEGTDNTLETSNKISEPPVSNLPDEEKKKQIDALWEDFLKDTDPQLASTSKPQPSMSDDNSMESKIDVSPTELKERSTKEVNGTTIVTEIFDFAGEEVRIDKIVTKSEAEKHELQKLKPQKRREPSGGLTDVVKMLSKKPKISVLDKTGHDWKQYVEEKGIEEDLKTYNRGQGGFLDKQDFLLKAEYKQFEQEREVRRSRREK